MKSDKCTVRITGVEWDFDEGEEADIPTDFTLCIDRDRANEDDLSDIITERYGFCHRGFSFRVLN